MKDHIKVFSSIIFFLMFSVLLFGQQSTEEFKVIIKPVFQGEEIQKNHWYILKKGDSIQLKKVKFHLTDFKFKLKDNTVQKIENSNFLIDVFTKKTLERTLILPNNKKYKTISFSLGVNEALNESGAHSGDLDPVNGMYWAWQSGYINMKIEGVSPECLTRKNKFTFHLGGFQKPYPTLRNLNFPVKKRQKEITVIVDIAIFLNEISLKENHSLMIPGERASLLTDIAVKMFSKE